VEFKISISYIAVYIKYNGLEESYNAEG